MFRWLMLVSALAIASTAEYISIYGLALTFHSAFWSVVAMGTVLGIGKLIGASYLYRYWKHTHWSLKTSLISFIFVLMLITSTGIFGFLTRGYQQDILPVKQLNEQIAFLQSEKVRLIERKKQIDDLLAAVPTIGPTTNKNGEIDVNATRAIQAATRARDQANQQYKVEQREATVRINQLDKDLLELKQKQIASNSEVGVIAYVGEAFGISPDHAVVILVILIVFVFDPMAMAMTIAFNTVQRIEDENKLKHNKEAPSAPPIIPDLKPDQPANPDTGSSRLNSVDSSLERYDGEQWHPVTLTSQPTPVEVQQSAMPPIETVEPHKDPEVVEQPANVIEQDQAPKGVSDQMIQEQVPVLLPEPVTTDDTVPSEPVVEPQPTPVATKPTVPASTPPEFLLMRGMSSTDTAKLMELLQHYQKLKYRLDTEGKLSPQENWEMTHLHKLLYERGLGGYLA